MKPPLNLRRHEPQVCGHCRYMSYPGDGTSRCTRPDGPVWDSGHSEEWSHTCDRFVRYDSKTERESS